MLFNIRGYIFYFFDKFKHILRRIKAVQQTVRNTVVPVDGNGNKTGVYVLPTLNGKQNIVCLCTAVKYG